MFLQSGRETHNQKHNQKFSILQNMLVLLVLYKLIQNLNNLNRPFKQLLANRKTNNTKIQNYIIFNYLPNYTFYQPIMKTTNRLTTYQLVY